MMFYDLLISTVLIVITCYGVNNGSEAYDANMVRDLKDYFQTRWIIIQSCSKSDSFVMNFRKELEKTMTVYISIFSWDDLMDSAVWPKELKALVIITCWSCRSDCLHRMNDMSHLPLSRFVWLAVGKPTAVMSITGLHIRLDCLFIIAERNESNSFTFWEIYRVSPEFQWVSNKIGHWNGTNFNFTSVSFVERRSDFQGQTITTLVEPPNSLNRLISVYKHYEPCYWDLAKRLNFTIQNTTDEKEEHEVSILLHFTDKASSEAYLQPIHILYQGIYFKDKGIKMQYDGYLKPFDITVWVSVLSVFILSGFLSYITSRLLRRVNKDDDQSYNMYIYIFQSLYILFQKCEFSGSSISQRIIIYCQWIVSVFIISCYSALFISFISVSIPKPPFTTVDGILESKTHNIVQTKHIDSGAMAVIKDSPDIKLRMLYEKHFDAERNVREDAIQFFCKNDNYLFITSELHIHKVRRTNFSCKISQTYIKLHMRSLAWTVTRGTQYERFFRTHIYKLGLAGTLNDHLNGITVFKKIPESSTFRDIHLKDVLILFITLAVGVFISLVLFVAEVAYKVYITKIFI